MILAIIQARMGSSRLPGKTLMKIHGKTILEHIIARASLSKHIDKFAIAITDNHYDDVLEAFIKKNLPKCDVFRGSENNVLERFYLCAVKYKPDYVVRITADDPLKDAEVIDKAIDILLKDPNLDYCSNTIEPTYPEGLDIEVFKFSALEKAYKEAKLDSEKEHVTPYIWKNPGKFKIKNFEYKENLSKWRWTLDKKEDFLFIQKIFDEFYKEDPLFSYKKVIEYLKKDPEVLLINSGTIRNEGYLKSLKKEE
jgi:spore coat polysaccharide biosynthesis protein SpsF (cytidylyltransferase family)